MRVRGLGGLHGIEVDEVVEARRGGPHRGDRRGLVDRQALRRAPPAASRSGRRRTSASARARTRAPSPLATATANAVIADRHRFIESSPVTCDRRASVVSERAAGSSYRKEGHHRGRSRLRGPPTAADSDARRAQRPHRDGLSARQEMGRSGGLERALLRGPLHRRPGWGRYTTIDEPHSGVAQIRHERSPHPRRARPAPWSRRSGRSPPCRRGRAARDRADSARRPCKKTD